MFSLPDGSVYRGTFVGGEIQGQVNRRSTCTIYSLYYASTTDDITRKRGQERLLVLVPLVCLSMAGFSTFSASASSGIIFY